MAKKLPGKLWFHFKLHGLEWMVRIVPDDHKALKDEDDGRSCMGLCFYNSRMIYVNQKMTHEQFRTTLAHEIQHAIEDAADVDYEKGAPEAVHDRWTDMVARGWLSLMRESPKVIEFLQARHDKPF